jgi:hypothetical protein
VRKGTAQFATRHLAAVALAERVQVWRGFGVRHRVTIDGFDQFIANIE